MIDTSAFKAQNTPKNRNRSKLAPYLDAILDLRKSGFTLEQVQTFLRGHRIETSVPNITMYLSRHKVKQQPNVPIVSSASTTPSAPELGDVFDTSFNAAAFMKHNTAKRTSIGKKIEGTHHANPPT